MKTKMKIKQGLCALLLAVPMILGAGDKADCENEERTKVVKEAEYKLPKECERVINMDFQWIRGSGKNFYVACEKTDGNYATYSLVKGCYKTVGARCERIWEETTFYKDAGEK